MIPVLGSQPAGDVSHKPGGRLPLLPARPAVTLETLKRTATSFAAWWTEARWVWTVCLRLLPDSVAAAVWTQALQRLSPARLPLGYRATLLGTYFSNFLLVQQDRNFCPIIGELSVKVPQAPSRDADGEGSPMPSRLGGPGSRGTS